jgi:flagellar motor switch/type III secretory pathway protein FliN
LGYEGCESSNEFSLIFLSHFWSLYCTFIRQMATTHPIPSLPAEQTPATNNTDLAQDSQALIVLRKTGPESSSGISLGHPLALLPVELDVAVPVREFRVRNLLALDRGQVIETQWGHGEDLPLASGDVQLAWSEFEVVESQLGVRVTRLA